MDYQHDNHRTKKKGAKKGSKNTKKYEPFDGAAFLKQLKQERADGAIISETPLPTQNSRK